MDKQQEQLETLREIRTLMERSSRFISLSGLSGVVAGVAALAGTAAAYRHFGLAWNEGGYYRFATDAQGQPDTGFYRFFLVNAVLVLTISLVAGSVLTMRKARKQGLPIWDATAERLLINMAIPLAAGALYCGILLYHGLIAFIAPATLIFYGLALLNASKYTLNDIRYLGVIEIVTGLFASIFIEHALLFWAFGFGVLHIVYGLSMYNKYEK